ncbi:MAG: glycosyltransferase family 2 protein [Lachnospiraceae bacterium]
MKHQKNKVDTKNTEKIIPKVSIIIPIYNVEKYLRECLDSVIRQTLKDIEIICVNDGSTDNSLEILNEYAQKDERIIIVTGPNGGYGHAINEGLQIATGKFIGIVESDDYILPEMYEVLYSVAQEYPELDMVKSDAMRFINGGEESECKYINVCASKLYNRVITISEEPDCYNAYMINTTGIYKRDIIVTNKIRLNESKGAAYQDNGLWFQLFTCSSKIMFIDKAFYMYRMDRAESSTNCTTLENALCIFAEWHYILDVLMSYGRNKVEEYKAVFSLRCYGSFYYHFTRVLEEYKLLFIKKFSEEMQCLLDEGILCTDLFLPYQCKDLFQILENPKLFYFRWCKENVNEFWDNQINTYVSLINSKISEANLAQQPNAGHDIQVSVIIPVYNAEKTIQRCIKSILCQKQKNIEIVCVDDGSTDRSLPILLMLAKQHSNIIVMSQMNSGAGAARNAALKVARGEFVSFMDPDDEYVADDVLMCLYNTAIKKQVSICGGNLLIVENGVTKNSKNHSFEQEGYIKYVDWQNSYGFQQFIFKKSLLLENDIEFPLYRRFQDPPFFVRAMIAAKEFYVVNKNVYKYYYEKNHVQWNEEKLCHLICGITDLIRISKEKKLEKLHFEAVRLLQQSFADRIMAFSNNSYRIIKLLCIAESEIDAELYNMSSEKKFETVSLFVLDKQLDKLKQMTPSGYIGPNAFKSYVNLLKECSDLKSEILEVQMAISYKVGVLFSGGKRKAYAEGYLIDINELNRIGKVINLDVLNKDKILLNQMLSNLRTSKAMRRGLKLTAVFRLGQKIYKKL